MNTNTNDKNFEAAVKYASDAWDKGQLSLGKAVVAAATYHKVDSQKLARHMLDYAHAQELREVE